jgi:hypothetical protein
VSSPYLSFVEEQMMTILVTLKARAIERGRFDRDSLLPDARRLLADAQADLARRVARNVLFNQP